MTSSLPQDGTGTFCKKSFLVGSLLFCVAIITRFWVMGNPFIFFDEEFYLFVGGRMLHGDLPYVDIWDRKPIGIFLLYEFFHLFGSYRIWAYQIGALLAAWGTSLLCVKMARLIAPPMGALCAGVLYLVWIVGAQGSGGEASIFYNLLVTWAMLLLARYLAGQSELGLSRLAVFVMGIFGLALQIKTTVVFEGIYAGLVLLWCWYRQGHSWLSLFGRGFIWCVIALVPTGCVMVFYGAEGHFHEWWFANVSSIFLKKTPSPTSVAALWRVVHWGVIMLAIFMVTTLLRWGMRDREEGRLPGLIFLAGWAWAAFAGFALFGSFSKHYSLPLFAPLFINAAPVWRAGLGRVWLALLLIWGGQRAYAGEKRINASGDVQTFKEIIQVLSSPRGCVFNYSGPDIVLDAVPYCSLTRFPFSAHLSYAPEAHALGVDPLMEIQRIFAHSPEYVVLEESKDDEGINTQIYAFLQGRLRTQYSEVYRFRPKIKSGNIIIFRKN